MSEDKKNCVAYHTVSRVIRKSHCPVPPYYDETLYALVLGGTLIIQCLLGAHSSYASTDMEVL